MTMRGAALLALSLVAGGVTPSAGTAQQANARSRININAGWDYLERSYEDPRALDTVSAGAWQRVDLPHTWNAFDATDVVPGYRREASWYRRSIEIATVANPPRRAGGDAPGLQDTIYITAFGRGRAAPGRQVLRFEGANTVAEVWVNGQRAGEHVGGYIGFDVDITPFIRPGRNEFLVRVDNGENPDLIPSHRGDFTIYGGLTRDVWLISLPPVHIARVAIRTEVDRESALVGLRVELRDHTRTPWAYTLEAVVKDPRGHIVSRASHRVPQRGPSGGGGGRHILGSGAGVGGGSTAADTGQVIELPLIASPMLWSPASPSLYTISVSLSAFEGELDRVEERIGLRWFRFAENGPFYLNGERLLLRGTHRHEEHAGLGAAVPNSRHRRDLELAKEMGANFIRLAHYPQDPEVYRTADSLGLLVWDELPWDRGGLGGPAWQANTKRLLREQIRQNINHPSIILWSLGNEVYDLVEEPNSGNTGALRGFLAELKAIAYELDPSRPTSMRKFDAGADVVDVYSPSIWAGWYRGVYRGYESAIADARAKFPRFFHMEYGADAHVGRHTWTPIDTLGPRASRGYEEAVGQPVENIARDGDWSESYQTDLMDWHLMVSERQDSLTGNAQWVFKDFATPLRPENPIPYVNQKGLLTRDGTPKDAYYVYKSYWTTSPKFAYIVSRTWTERSGPKGTPRSVRVYSNCTSVELSANGKPLGAKRRVRDDFPAQGLRWDVSFVEGANSLVARCTGTGEQSVRDSLGVRYTFETAGRAEQISVTTSPLADGRLLVEAVLVDGKGRRVLSAHDRVYFYHHGDGELLADLGTPTGSRVIEAANGRAAIELVAPRGGERAVIVVRTQVLNGTRLIIEGPRPSAAAGSPAPK